MIERYETAIGQHCAGCGAMLDSAINADRGDPHPPDDGAVALCLYCGAAVLFEHGAWRQPTDAEQIGIATDPVIKSARQMLAILNRPTSDPTAPQRGKSPWSLAQRGMEKEHKQ